MDSISPRPTISLKEAKKSHEDRMARRAVASLQGARASSPSVREGIPNVRLTGTADKMRAEYDKLNRQAFDNLVTSKIDEREDALQVRHGLPTASATPLSSLKDSR